MTQLCTFEPENALEQVIADASAGARSLDDVLSLARVSVLYVSSKTEVQQSGVGFEPLLLGGKAGPLVAVFTSLARPQLHRHKAEYVLQMNGAEFFRRLPRGYGVIINPGYETQIIIESAAVNGDVHRG